MIQPGVISARAPARTQYRKLVIVFSKVTPNMSKSDANAHLVRSGQVVELPPARRVKTQRLRLPGSSRAHAPLSPWRPAERRVPAERHRCNTWAGPVQGAQTAAFSCSRSGRV